MMELPHLHGCVPVIVNGMCVGGCQCYQEREAILVAAMNCAITVAAKYARPDHRKLARVIKAAIRAFEKSIGENRTGASA